MILKLLHIGVLGGMGPGSTNLFLKKIAWKFTSISGATANHEFPKITMITIPDSDHMSEKADNTILSNVQNIFNVFRISMVDFIVAPCNSIHSYFTNDNVIPILKIPSTVGFLYGDVLKGKKTLFLSTSITRHTNLYQNISELYNIYFIYLKDRDQELLDSLILAVNGGICLESHTTALQEIINKYRVEAILLACTELSLFDYSNLPLVIVDSLEALSETTYLVSSGLISLSEL